MATWTVEGGDTTPTVSGCRARPPPPTGLPSQYPESAALATPPSHLGAVLGSPWGQASLVDVALLAWLVSELPGDYNGPLRLKTRASPALGRHASLPVKVGSFQSLMSGSLLCTSVTLPGALLSRVD